MSEKMIGKTSQINPCKNSLDTCPKNSWNSFRGIPCKIPDKNHLQYVLCVEYFFFLRGFLLNLLKEILREILGCNSEGNSLGSCRVNS